MSSLTPSALQSLSFLPHLTSLSASTLPLAKQPSSTSLTKTFHSTASTSSSPSPSPSPSSLSLEDRTTRHERDADEVEYRMYPRRWVGVIALMILNLVAGMSLVWFGPIADDVTTEFGFNLDQVNWLGNCINIVYLPVSALIPFVYARLGVRKTCYIGGLLFVLSAWIRYAGTATGLTHGGAYALILVGQIIAGVAQPIFQVLIPGYSEKWFDLRSRTTATMLMSIANPIGNALGQLISPLVGSPSESILVMGIIFTAAAPCVLVIRDAPPSPPTHAAAQRSPSFVSLARALVGREPRDLPTYMKVRERIDFAILTLAFGIFVGVVNAFGILTAQELEPYGYSDDISGLMGATILLVGIVAAAVTAPLFDRVFTYRLALTCKLLCPPLGGAWLSLIWAVRANDTGGLFAIMAIIGTTSLTLLPVALELVVELTRNADGSSAILWASSNLFGIIFVLAEGALRAGPSANPPNNMHTAIIFQGVMVCGVVLLVFFIEGRQTRRKLDEQAQAQMQREMAERTLSPPTTPAPATAARTYVDRADGSKTPVGRASSELEASEFKFKSDSDSSSASERTVVRTASQMSMPP